MMKCVSLLSLALVGVVNAERAHLIVEKSFANPPVVEGKDVNVTLTVTNIGETAANDVVLSDKVRTQFFVLTGGEPVTKFDTIGSGETVEHTYTVAALKKGFTRMDRAVINYKYTDDSGEEQSAKGMSTTVFVGREDGGVQVMEDGSLESGLFKVFTVEEEGANSSTANNEWILFWVMFGLSVGGPYYLYNEEQKKVHKRR